MAGDAFDTIKNFWTIQDSGDYSKLGDLFTEDAIVEDPVYGTFRGREAITEFMTKMVDEMGKAGVHFVADEIAGDNETAWCQWTAVYSTGKRRAGVGIYKVRDGKLSYYRDYMNAEEG